jgi:predicted GIY-YIG superfamily endonuclease
MWHYVYILELSNSTHYVGCTTNIRERFSRHSKGYVPATDLIFRSKNTKTFQDFVRAGKSLKEFSRLNDGSSDVKPLSGAVFWNSYFCPFNE